MKINVTLQLLLCSCFMNIASYGQTSKGSFLLGGSMGFSSNTNTTYATNSASSEDKSFSITAQPSISYFIIDRLAVGLITPYSYSRTKYEPVQDLDVKLTIKTYSVGPTLRYYFPLGNQWAIFPEVSYSYGWIWGSTPYFSAFVPTPTVTYVKSTEKTRIFLGGVGLVYFLNQSIGVEGRAYYQNQRSTYDGDLGIRSSDEPYFNFSLGVQIYFARKANP